MDRRTRNRTRIAIIVLAVAVLVAVSAHLAVTVLGRRSSYTLPTISATASAILPAPPAERRPAEPMAFAGPDGRPTSLADFRGRVVLVNLWATWCPPCIAEMPALETLQRRQGGEGFQVVAISLDRGGAEAVRRWYAQEGIAALPVYTAPPGSFGTVSLPTSILIDAEGRVAWRGLGARDWDGAEAEAAVASLLAERPAGR